MKAAAAPAVEGQPPFFSWSNALSWAKIIFIIFFIKGCVIDQYTVPTGSMEPTIHGDPGYFTGDRIVVNKWKYGVRIPFTASWLYRWGAPQRWDIVVFKPLPTQSKFPILVKRVVGLPGDHVLIHEGKIEVNGKLLDFPDFMPKEAHYYNRSDLVDILRDPKKVLGHDEMTLDDKMRNAYGMLQDRDGPVYGCIDKPEYTVVPEGHYFVLGDNSFESLDARFWGWLPQDRILGPVFGIWWPLPHRRDFSGFSHTWWGASLLYGIPLCIVGMEIRIQLLERKRRRLLAEQGKKA